MKRIVSIIFLSPIFLNAHNVSLALQSSRADLENLKAHRAQVKEKYKNDPEALKGVLLDLNTKQSDLEREIHHWEILNNLND